MKLRNKMFTGIAAVFGVAIAALAITISHESPCPSAPRAAVSGASMRAVMQRLGGILHRPLDIRASGGEVDHRGDTHRSPGQQLDAAPDMLGPDADCGDTACPGLAAKRRYGLIRTRIAEIG
jgi:hypothetical protein